MSNSVNPSNILGFIMLLSESLGEVGFKLCIRNVGVISRNGLVGDRCMALTVGRLPDKPQYW